MKELLSPLTLTNNLSLVKQIKKDEIIKDYRKFNIDVTSYFQDITKISLYKCNDTGYQFFHPLNLSGNSQFYEHFQEFDWYYMPWKWEHEITKSYLSDGLKLLEVGCAKGAFIKKVNELFSLEQTCGLELNESAVAKHDKWAILNESVQSFATHNKNRFDIVCSYQVLEHISEVKSFLESKIECLKKDGKLIISVPNNNSFLKHADNCLNMPPHHMGLWNEDSLRSLENFFPLKVLDVHFEDLQEYHIEDYVSAIHYSKYSKRTVGKIVRKINKIFGLHQAMTKKVALERKLHIGQTILVVYQKT